GQKKTGHVTKLVEVDDTTQILRKKITLDDHSMPDFVVEALKRSKKRSEEQRKEERCKNKSRQQLEDEGSHKKVQMEMDRISVEASTDAQTLPKNRTKIMEEKAKLKREAVQWRRDQFLDRKKREKQLKDEARQTELLKIMMLMDDDERRKRQKEERRQQEEDKKRQEEERRQQEEDKKRQEEERRQQEEEVISICKKIGENLSYRNNEV
ncbi:unnamed protein product, partial [Mytilus edulis]